MVTFNNVRVTVEERNGIGVVSLRLALSANAVKNYDEGIDMQQC
jgi:hypothetical protein